LRFHTIYWPIMLMALDIPLPKQIFGHPWLLQGDGKMSKSKGNVIYADDLVEMFGVDAVRYFVLHEMPFENDGIITWELMVERMNSELANTLGNLVNRTIAMTNKYFGGVVNNTDAVTDFDEDLMKVVTSTRELVEKNMDKLRVADAMTEIFTLFKRCNKYIDETMPWALAKDESKQDELAHVLYNLVESITIGANLLTPYMPETAERILAQLNAQARDYDDLNKFGLRENGVKVTDTPEIHFARLDLEEVLAKAEEIQKKQLGPQYPQVEAKPEITIDDFDKIQIQVGEIMACEPVKKSKKLLVSQVMVGGEMRQIVSGIAAYYKPEEMVGKKVAVITNLKPCKLCGVESQGMILAAGDDAGNLSVMTVDRDIINGSEIC
ncbi:MAG: methionine--tRNA ligase subunit beta, partial [Clostridia bacterium]|nr:methionine--tRNA ligase subunit beta [Clostridia bacterium]